MTPVKESTPEKKNVTTIGGDVVDSVIITGDNNTVNQTFIQKIINIFKSDAETLEQRNRRILLNHVENAWIKGVLDASLHGAALLDLGIKQDPEAVIQYPWAIKKESTNETLPAGTSMLEIFDSIGMGRSLLILGAPGSGKTTMLLELARGLIARAREDVTQPIPMVFNLASWTEKLSLADWLAQELNNLYSVPRKTAPDWVKGNKLLLLLDGLDEVRQESRAKCVEAINAFRKEHGMTSLAVCSRSQDYADLKAKLSFEGAIEVQPLAQKQITEFFNRFGDEMADIKQALNKDTALREIAETPLFLSIMAFAFQDKQSAEHLVSRDSNFQRKHLFDTYIAHMFTRRGQAGKESFSRQHVLRWLPWLARKMIKHNQSPFFIERLQPDWFEQGKQLWTYRWFVGLIAGLIIGLLVGIIRGPIDGAINGLIAGLGFGLITWILKDIQTVDTLTLNPKGLLFGLVVGLIASLITGLMAGVIRGPNFGLIAGAVLGLFAALIYGFGSSLKPNQIDREMHPGEKLSLSAKNFFFVVLIFGLIFGLTGWLFGDLVDWLLLGLFNWLIFGLIGGLIIGINFGGHTIIRHYTLRFILARNNLLPWRLVPFLNHCVDLIFLRRVGGGYIFIHRLLMEHFAEMYVETTK